MRDTFAARAGRWSTQHRGMAIGLWLAFVLLAVAAGQAAGLVKSDDNGGTGETARAERAIDHDFPKGADESVLVQAPRGATVLDARVRAAVRDVVRSVERKPHVVDVVSPYAAGAADEISPDRHSALVSFELRGGDETTSAAVGPVVDAVNAVAERHPGVFVGQFGDASAEKAISDATGEDFAKAETLSLPITLLILLVAFGVARRRRRPGAARPDRRRRALGRRRLAGTSCRWTRRSPRSCCSSAWPSASTTRSSTCAASARSAPRGASTARRSDAAGDLRPRRARLRPHGDDRDGRHVLRRQRDLHVLGVGAIIVVAVAMLGSSRSCPPSSPARRPRRARPHPVHRQRRARAATGAAALWGAVVGRVLRRPRRRASLAGGAARRPRAPRARACNRAAGHRRPAARPRRHEDLRPHPGGVPGRPTRRSSSCRRPT